MSCFTRVRTMDRRTRRCAAIALAALALATLVMVSPTRAASMTTSQTLSIPTTQTNWGPGSSSTPGPLEFSKFDPALGALSSVQISLAYTFNHNISLTFDSPSTLTETTIGSQIVVNGPGGGLYLKATPNPVTETQTNSAGPYPSTVTIPSVTESKSTGPLTLTSPADLALYTAQTAGAKIGLPVLAQSNSEFTSSTGNGQGQINTSAAAEVTVSYTYTPVPEPSTLALLGLGGAALLAHRRRAAAR
jgi:hypothetical protein